MSLMLETILKKISYETNHQFGNIKKNTELFVVANGSVEYTNIVSKLMLTMTNATILTVQRIQNVLTGSTCMQTPNSSLRMPPLKTMEASSDIDFKDVCHNSVSGVIGDNIVYMTSTNLKAYFITYSADRLQILLYCCIHWVNRIFLSFSV